MEAFEEVADLCLLEDVVDGEHGDEVLALLEAFEGGAADALGGGVGVGEVGVGLFEVLEFAEEAVVFGVGDFGLGLVVVEAVVTLEFLAEGGDAGGGVGGRLGEEVVHGGNLGGGRKTGKGFRRARLGGRGGAFYSSRRGTLRWS